MSTLISQFLIRTSTSLNIRGGLIALCNRHHFSSRKSLNKTYSSTFCYSTYNNHENSNNSRRQKYKSQVLLSSIALASAAAVLTTTQSEQNFTDSSTTKTSVPNSVQSLNDTMNNKSQHRVPMHTIEEDTTTLTVTTNKKSVFDDNTSDDCFTEWNKDLQNLTVFSGTSNPELAHEICSHLGIPLGRARIGSNDDGEIQLELLDEIRGQNVFIIQSSPSASSSIPSHSALMELFFMVSAAKRASAKQVTAILPYSRYFRQTIQPSQSRPLAGADVGQILIAMGVDRVIFIDVHTQRIDGLFHDTIPITNLQPQSLAVEYFRRKSPDQLSEDVVVVSTENTGTEKAMAFMSRMNNKGFKASMATLISNRPERTQRSCTPAMLPSMSQIEVVPSKTPTQKAIAFGRSETAWLVGDVAGKDCIIVDDIIDTAERAVNAAHVLKHAKARKIYMFATHGLFSRGAIDQIVKSPIHEVVVTDTIKQPEYLYCEKLRVVSVSKLLAETIRRVHLRQPLSVLHRDTSFDTVMSSTWQKQ